MSDMREEMLRTLDRIVEDNVTTEMREAADDKGSGGGGGAPGAGPGNPGTTGTTGPDGKAQASLALP